MEFFRNTTIDFMRARRIWLPVSVIAVLASLAMLFVLGGLNLGIDFTGGSQVTLRFAEEPELDELRSILAGAGIEGAQIQRFGDAGSKEVILKVPSRHIEALEGVDDDAAGDAQRAVVAAFDSRYNADLGTRLDLNQQGSESLTDLLVQNDPDALLGESSGFESGRSYREVAAAIMALRKDSGLIESWQEVGDLEEVTPATLATLQETAGLGRFSVLAAETVGDQIGSELRVKGILAVVFSLIGMLTYIWLRFELRFGMGALMALVHDVSITLGLYALMGYEFNLTSIAAFLTVVGYSVNDTVVVFDRVRENLRRNRRDPLEVVLNRSLNQTLSRTVLTSGTTLLVVGTLYVFGGGGIRGLAFVLLTGVMVGTYSSIFVASPVVLLWEKLFGREAKSRRAAQAA